ncbi:CHAD domain-containing protein [Sphingobium aquiterrae]|uniref:CYTH and CHAD domain-containing protein n=1 Tax=Sphingobium aquiterrae TaxID=2038656 RepID=UPI003018EE09
MAEEIELKLELTPDAGDALEASVLLGIPVSRTSQRSTYFDTPDRQLFAHGLSLRIRNSGGKLVQTVKADDGKAAGLFARPEWEMPVRTETPIVDARTPITTLTGADAGTIAPVFAVQVERICWNVAAGDAQLEVVLDRGAVIAGTRRQPVCEVELELKSGTPASLFAFADRMAAIAPLRLGVLSKAERGYRLLARAPGACRAEPIALPPGTTAAKAFQAIAHACLRQYRLNEAILLQGRQPEALHQARVALRRLRSAFFIFAPMLADHRADHFRIELRWLSNVLGDARNIDVLIANAPPGALRDRLQRAADDAYAHVERVLASARVRTLMLALAEWLAAGPWLQSRALADIRDGTAADFATGALARLRKRLKTRGRHLEEIDDEARHDIRKTAKKLRYASEFFASLFPRKRQRHRHRRFIDRLEALQDHLGALNDRATAVALFDHLGLQDSEDARAMFAHIGKTRLIASAAEALDELVDARKFWV